MYQNDSEHSLKSSKQHSYESKHKKCPKCNTRHRKQAYPKTTELNVPRNPRCNVGCQSYKVDVRNELYSIQVWVLIKSRLWCVCHKSRESDTWWEVSEMILACNLQLPKIDPCNQGCLCMLSWEKPPMHASLFFLVPEETVNSVAHARCCSTAGRKCGFLAGRYVGCLEDFHNLWAEQLTAA